MIGAKYMIGFEEKLLTLPLLCVVSCVFFGPF